MTTDNKDKSNDQHNKDGKGQTPGAANVGHGDKKESDAEKTTADKAAADAKAQGGPVKDEKGTDRKN